MVAAPTSGAPYALIAFDLDGTLVDTERHGIPNMLSFLAQTYNILITPETWHATYLGQAGQGLLDTLNQHHGTQLQWDEFAPKRFAALAALEAELGVTAAPGMLPMLRRVVGSGQQVAIVSNSTSPRILAKLQQTTNQRQHGLLLPTLFDGHIFSGIEPGRRSKPAPDVYLAAAAYYGHNPAHCLAIEDSVTGVQAAVAAGFTCWGYTGLAPDANTADRLIAAGAAHTLAHWDEFMPATP